MTIIYKTRTQLVVEILREQIINGEIKAGQALRQAALAEELNVSRIPVREALLQLEAEGLVSFEPHRGATATDLSSDQIDELFELRAMLEADLLTYS
ncbi:MAG: DNA-binding GntR family transcriptional regulator, partial [Alteromonadaceae bacterium]